MRSQRRTTGAVAARLAVLVAVAAMLLAGCSDDSSDDTVPVAAGPVTTTTSPPTVPVTPPPDGSTPPSSARPTSSEPADPTARLVGRLKGSDPTRIKLGGEFNRRFLSMYLQGVGFDPNGAECIATKIATLGGPTFAQLNVTQVFSGLQRLDTQAVQQCVGSPTIACLRWPPARRSTTA